MNVSRVLHRELDNLQLSLLESPDLGSQGKTEKDLKLQAVVKSLDHPPKITKLASILANYEFSASSGSEQSSEWFVLARATAVVVEATLAELFSRTLPLTQDILYWEQLLSSQTWRAVYSVQSKLSLESESTC